MVTPEGSNPSHPTHRETESLSPRNSEIAGADQFKMPYQVNPGGALDTSLRAPNPESSDEPKSSSQTGEPSQVPSSPISISPRRVASTLVSPASLTGAGNITMSLPISLPFTVAYSLVTALSLRNELRAESRAPSAGGPPNDQDTGIVRRTLNSPGVVCAFTSAVALTQGIYLLASGEPVLGGAYIATGIGNGALANLSNRQLGYSILEEKESRIGRVWRSIVRGTPKKLKTALSNPVVGFAVANTLFSFSTLEPDPSSAQLTAMSIGIGFGLVAAIRGMMRDSRALTTSLILGGLSVAGHAGNAIIGGAGVTAAALALWSAQHFSSYTRERERETQ